MKCHRPCGQEEDQTKQVEIKKVLIRRMLIEFSGHHAFIVQWKQKDAQRKTYPGCDRDPVDAFDILVFNKFRFHAWWKFRAKPEVFREVRKNTFLDLIHYSHSLIPSPIGASLQIS